MGGRWAGSLEQRVAARSASRSRIARVLRVLSGGVEEALAVRLRLVLAEVEAERRAVSDELARIAAASAAFRRRESA